MFFKQQLSFYTILSTGVTVTSDPLPFTVGQNAVLTCTSDTGVSDLIEWVTKDGVVLASNTAVEELQLVLSTVNDSLSVHMADFICIVTRNNLDPTTSNQTLPVTVIGMCHTLPTALHGSINCIHTHPLHLFHSVCVHVISVVDACAGLLYASTFSYHIIISFSLSLSLSVVVPTPAISTDISMSGSLVAGSEFTLTCVVSELISGLTDMPDVMWMRTAGDAVPGALSVTRTDEMAVAVLTFDPVRTSYSGEYICTGSLASPTKSTPLEVLDRVDFIFRSKLVLLMQCLMLTECVFFRFVFFYCCFLVLFV